MPLMTVVLIAALLWILLSLFDRWIPLSDQTKKYVGATVTTALILVVLIWLIRLFV